MTVVEKSASSAPTARAELRWSYANGTSDVPLLGLTIGDMFDQTVEKYPDQPALISRQQNVRLTYRQLQEQVNRCAKGFMQLGFQKGQRVGIWAPNRAEWCITQFATSKIGVILVNINPSYRLHELEYALKQSGCSAIVISPAFKTSNYTEMITTLAPVWAKLMAVLTAVVVFPSPGKLDVTSNDFGAWPAVESKTEVRRCR